MYFFGLVLSALSKVLSLVVNLYQLLIAVAVLFSWIRPDPYNPIVRFVYQITTPFFKLVRRIIPQPLLRLTYRTGIDWTPLLALILLILFETIVVGLLQRWAFVLLASPH